MFTAIQFGERQLTIDLISQHLTTSSLLPQVLREMVMDEILADSQIEIDRSEVESICDRLVQAPMYQGFDRAQLIPIVNRIVKLQKIKQAGWGNKVYSYFLQRKSALDGVVYSIIQVHDPEIAQELLFRVRSGEYSFAELAFKYSQSDEARDGGKISPPEVVTNLKFQPQPDRVTRWQNPRFAESISKLVHLAFWLLSLATVSSLVSMNWEDFKLKSNPVDSTIDSTRFNRADRYSEQRDLPS